MADAADLAVTTSHIESMTMLDLNAFVLYLAGTYAVAYASAHHGHVTDARSRAAAGVFVVLLSAGQSTLIPGHLYPFDHWGMYSNPNAQPAYVAHVVTDASGETFQYLFRLVAFAEPRALAMRIEQLVRACGCNRSDRVVDAIIVRLAAHYERRTGREIRRYDVLSTVIDVVRGTHTSLSRYSWSR